MPKIMVVEDDQSLREIYSIRLTAEGFELVSAGDGEEALAVAVKEKPDLIISDVMMPKISGFDMLDILRSTPETKNIKVIMMTALSSDDQRKRGENLGADKYLVKSQVGIEDVIAAVREVLGIQGSANLNNNGGTEMNNLESQPSVGAPENPVATENVSPAEAPATPEAGMAAGLGAVALNQVAETAQNAVAGAQAAVAGVQDVASQAVNTVQGQVAAAQEAVAGIQNAVANAGAALQGVAQNLQATSPATESVAPAVAEATPAPTESVAPVSEAAANPVAEAPVASASVETVATPGLVVGTNEAAGAPSGAEVTPESVVAAAPAGMEGTPEVMSSASVVVPDGVSSVANVETVSPVAEAGAAGVDTSGLAEMQDMLAHTSVEELDPNAATAEATTAEAADAGEVPTSETAATGVGAGEATA